MPGAYGWTAPGRPPEGPWVGARALGLRRTATGTLVGGHQSHRWPLQCPRCSRDLPLRFGGVRNTRDQAARRTVEPRRSAIGVAARRLTRPDRWRRWAVTARRPCDADHDPGRQATPIDPGRVR